MRDGMFAMNTDTLVNRIERAEDYLLALEALGKSHWADLYRRYKTGELTLAQSMVLVHPRYYEARECETGVSVRGPRLFPEDVSRHKATCMASILWLVDCRLTSYETVHSDHEFPYSLGGPTLASNRVLLCPL